MSSSSASTETCWLHAKRTRTIWDTEIIMYDGADGEWATVRVLDTLYTIVNDGGNLVWNSLGVSGTYTPRIEFQAGEHEGLSRDMGTPKLPYNLTWHGYITTGPTPYHLFTVEILNTYECVRGNNVLPSNLAAELVDPVNVQNASSTWCCSPPPYSWGDFNEWHRTYRIYKHFATWNIFKLLCPEDLPDEPKAECYD